MGVKVVLVPAHTVSPWGVLRLTDAATVGVTVIVALPPIKLLQPVTELMAITV
jgi:hypothetical protein